MAEFYTGGGGGGRACLGPSLCHRLCRGGPEQ